MSFRKDEAIAVRIIGRYRIDPQNPAIENRDDVGDRECRADV